MARLPRAFAEGVALHVVQRGNNRNACFADAADRLVYLAMLGDLCGKTGCAIHAYVLMTNHVHLLMTPQSAVAPSRLMQRLGMRYAAYSNRRHDRTGTLWEGRFRAAPVTSDKYVLACHRYIELNPVRAGMVLRPEDYSWSSHLANIGMADRGFLVIHPTVEAMGHSREITAQRYRRLFDAPLDDAILTAFRQGIARPSAQSGSDLNLTPV